MKFTGKLTHIFSYEFSCADGGRYFSQPLGKNFSYVLHPQRNQNQTAKKKPQESMEQEKKGAKGDDCNIQKQRKL